MIIGRLALLAAGILALNGPANANIVLNGNFTSGPGASTTSPGIGSSVADWTSTKAYFVYGSSPSSSIMLNSHYSAPILGGNALGLDIYSSNGTQTITYSPGLSVIAGSKYSLTYYQALDQGAGDSSAATGDWTVDVNGVSIGTSSLVSVSGSSGTSTFSGWQEVTETFTATTTGTEALAFLNGKTATGSEPPILLLANVSVTKVPEPASFALLGGGLFGLAVLRRRRLRAR